CTIAISRASLLFVSNLLSPISFCMTKIGAASFKKFCWFVVFKSGMLLFSIFFVMISSDVWASSVCLGIQLGLLLLIYYQWYGYYQFKFQVRRHAIAGAN